MPPLSGGAGAYGLVGELLSRWLMPLAIWVDSGRSGGIPPNALTRGFGGRAHVRARDLSRRCEGTQRARGLGGRLTPACLMGAAVSCQRSQHRMASFVGRAAAGESIAHSSVRRASIGRGGRTSSTRRTLLRGGREVLLLLGSTTPFYAVRRVARDRFWGVCGVWAHCRVGA